MDPDPAALPAEPALTGKSGGGLAGLHGLPLPAALVGTSTEGQKNTLRVAMMPFACWRMEDMRFEFDSSFVLASAHAELALLVELLKAHPGARLSVFGHADPVGNFDYNKALSGRRAKAVYALLTQQPRLWEQLHSQPHGGDDWSQHAIQRCLSALGFAPGAGPASTDQQTKEAVRSFQRKEGLGADGAPGPNTRAKLFERYMERVRPPGFVLAAADFLGGGADAGGKADFQGCSEFNPVLIFSQPEQQEFAREENHSRRNAENAPNRRVVIFLFRPGTEVDLSKWPCPRASEGTAGCVKRLHTDAAQRQAPGPTRREYAKGEATFSCRFYDRLSQRSPCERPSEFSSLLQWVSHVPPDQDAARLHQAIPKASLGTVKGRSVGQDNLGLPYRAYSIHPLRPQPIVKLQIRGDGNPAALGPDITVDLMRALVAPATGAEGARGVFGIAPPPPPETPNVRADEEPTIEPPAFDPNEPRLEVPPEDEVPGQPESPHGR